MKRLIVALVLITYLLIIDSSAKCEMAPSDIMEKYGKAVVPQSFSEFDLKRFA